MKSEIVERLGETDILLPSLIAEGLAANDRVKARLSVMQAAGQHARDPKGVRFNLTEESRSAGIDPMPLEALVNQASLLADARIAAPGLGKLGHAIWDDVAAMVRAVKAGDAAKGEAVQARFAATKAAAWPEPSDTIELAQIARLTGVSGSAGDGLHRLVMDLHKALNHLAAAHAEEVLAGAHAYGLLPEDRPAVEAFMRGLEFDTQAEIRPSGPGDDRDALGRAAHHSERYRRDRRACRGDRG